MRQHRGTNDWTEDSGEPDRGDATVDFGEVLRFEPVEPVEPPEPVEGLGYRRGAWILGGVAVALVAGLVFAAVLVFSGDDPAPSGLASETDRPTAGAAVPELSETAEPSTSPSPAASSAPASPSPSRRSASPKRSIVPSKRPVTEPVAPAPAATATATGNCPTYPGPTSTKAQVRAKLETVSTHTYWKTSAPELRVPLALLKAVAWQESGWQSAILACDGGMGTMQVMPNTATWMNDRFGTSWNANTFDGNIMLGGQYLAWLIKYMGDVYYDGLYDVTAEGAEGLLNAVISGYQAGAGAVDPTKGTSGIPNWSYVNNVRALMTDCPCSQY
ncbi:MAG: lytic transglycosylase domain-containing protein [Micromonosporaceae bacterium]|nr:lytic transglycosylase domain-containing protein [Micromonosporaceae bacterium]